MENTLSKLDLLESESIYVLREAYKKFGKIAVLWSMGKDSTALLWLIRKAFFGRIPFPAVHVDTTFKFPEMYQFREKLKKEWNVNLLVYTNTDALEKGINYKTHDPLTVLNELKTNVLKKCVEENKFEALILAIRHDEEGSRAKERFFSKRNTQFAWNYTDQPPELWNQFNTDFQRGEHIRVHPMLNWTELDVWEYIMREKIPIISLYLAKNGKRYRSLGCMPITFPTDSNANTIPKIITELKKTKISERAGRGADKADPYALQKLRAKGHM